MTFWGAVEAVAGDVLGLAAVAVVKPVRPETEIAVAKATATEMIIRRE